MLRKIFFRVIFVGGIALTASACNNPLAAKSPTPSLTRTSSFPTQVTDKFGVPMVLVPAGEFKMGSNQGAADEKPVFRVFLDDFYIDQYEVTNLRYAACVQAGKCTPPKEASSSTRTDFGNLDFANYPVLNLNWYQAMAYCEWRGGRLPTEAEWEKAARGTDGRLYPWGDEWDPERANYCEISCNQYGNDGTYDDGYAATAPVGSFSAGASPYGIMDMAGNVAEWVADWYAEDWYLTSSYADSVLVNPAGPENRETKVLRGGSWLGNSRRLRAIQRDAAYPGQEGAATVGFRCAGWPGN
jgi:eukaryotic-like serine/threonine-protein kinase